MRKIALSGMRGRRRDAVYLVFVITLSLMFMTVATQLLSSIKETKRQQNFNVFGQWKVVLMFATEEEAESLLAQSETLGAQACVSKIIAQSSQAGVIGVINDELTRIGRFKMHEGRMPQADNEIAVEMSRLGEMSGNIKLGDEITIDYEINLPTGDARSYEEYYEEALWPLVESERGPITDEEIADYRRILSGMSVNERYFDSLEKRGRDAILHALKMHYIQNCGYGEISYNKQDPILYEGIRQNVLTVYKYLYANSETRSVSNEKAVSKGWISSRVLTVSRTYTLTGVIQSYSDRWDAGNYQFPNAFVSEAGSDKLNAAYRSMIDRLDYDFDMPVEHHVYLNAENHDVKTLFHKTAALVWPEDNTDWVLLSNSDTQWNDMNLRMNPMAYPAGLGKAEDTLASGVLYAVFLITVCAVFQIFFTQINRRKKRVVLLKAVGASNSQLARMLIWESGFILIVSLPAGVILGGLFAYGAVRGYNVLGGGPLSFAPDIMAVLLGTALSCASVFIGMAGPLIVALRLSPVRGIRETEGVKLWRVSGRDCRQRMQTFAEVCRRRRRVERGRGALSLGLSTFVAVILFTALTLSFLFFKDYHDKERYENIPDYVIRINQGVSPTYMSSVINEIEKIPGVESVNALKKAERLYISFENMELSESLSSLKTILPESALYEHFGGKRESRPGFAKGNQLTVGLEAEPMTEGTYIADLYGVDMGSAIYKQLKNAVTAGNVNESRFKAGEEAILLVPLYLKGLNYNDPPQNVHVPAKLIKEERMRALLEGYDVLSISTDKRNSGYYKTEDAIKPGESIGITVSHESIVNENLIYKYAEHDITVGGIIYFFPDKAVWPFSQYREGYTLIGSRELVDRVYPMAKGNRENDRAFDTGSVREHMFPAIFGQTLFSVYGDTQASREQTDLGLLSLCKKNGYTFYNNKDMIREVFAAALNKTVIVCLLGLAAALIAGVILYNTEESAVAQDRHRIGLLQALGVTEKELRRWKWKTGLSNGLISLSIANVIVFGVAVIASVTETRGVGMTLAQRILDVVFYQLSNYPWAVHSGLCLIYLLTTMLIYRIPIRAAVKHSPVENKNA